MPADDSAGIFGGFLMKYLRFFGKVIHRVSRFFSWVASISLFLMMFLTACDVTGRYIFNYPILGTQDLVELALVICVFGALGHTTLARGHIRADMLNPVLSKRNNAILGACSFILCLTMGILLTWQTSLKAVETLQNMHMTTSTISIPVGPFFAFAAFGLFLMTIEMIFDVIRYVREARDPDNPKYSGNMAEDDFANM
jgi:TRAP-type C4-dicarboxylate transport system permease small subunit